MSEPKRLTESENSTWAGQQSPVNSTDDKGEEDGCDEGFLSGHFEDDEKQNFSFDGLFHFDLTSDKNLPDGKKILDAFKGPLKGQGRLRRGNPHNRFCLMRFSLLTSAI